MTLEFGGIQLAWSDQKNANAMHSKERGEISYAADRNVRYKIFVNFRT